MTLEDVKSMPDAFITADIVAQIIGASPQAIRMTARDEPWRLGFPSTTYGSRAMFPREPFIEFVESGKPWYLTDMMLDKLAGKVMERLASNKTPLPV